MPAAVAAASGLLLLAFAASPSLSYDCASLLRTCARGNAANPLVIQPTANLLLLAPTHDKPQSLAEAKPKTCMLASAPIAPLPYRVTMFTCTVLSYRFEACRSQSKLTYKSTSNCGSASSPCKAPRAACTFACSGCCCSRHRRTSRG